MYLRRFHFGHSVFYWRMVERLGFDIRIMHFFRPLDERLLFTKTMNLFKSSTLCLQRALRSTASERKGFRSRKSSGAATQRVLSHPDGTNCHIRLSTGPQSFTEIELPKKGAAVSTAGATAATRSFSKHT